MIKSVILAVLVFLLSASPVEAYNPPPAARFFLLTTLTRVEIWLPPRLIMTPDRLLFPSSGTTYTFSGDKFVPDGQPYLRHRVLTKPAGSGDAAYYIITITGFKRDELPTAKDFRLTFKPAVSKESIDRVENFLKNSSVPTARLTGAGCAGDDGSHICLDSITKVRLPSRRLNDAHLRQTIPIRGIFVEGNVAAPGTISNFSLGSRSLAVGGSITLVNGTQLPQYLRDQTVSFRWNNVESQLNTIFDRRDNIAPKITSLGNQFTGPLWQLNSADNNNPAAGATSFSTPPEGKLWNVVVGSDKFTFGDGSGQTNFSGSGTIVFSRDGGGKVDLIFEEPITCAVGTRLAILTEGKITFRAPSATNSVEIGCGAYTSLDSGIDFAAGTVKSGRLTGIFIAKENINLPNPDNLIAPFSIKRDSLFATNPTILLRELLKVVFGVSS